MIVSTISPKLSIGNIHSASPVDQSILTRVPEFYPAGSGLSLVSPRRPDSILYLADGPRAVARPFGYEWDTCAETAAAITSSRSAAGRRLSSPATAPRTPQRGVAAPQHHNRPASRARRRG